ncbi:DUF6261 family protein [Labilibaculum euxinus]
MNKVSYYLFSHNALFTFVKDSIGIIEESPAEDLGLKVFLDMVKARFQIYESVLQHDKVDPYTAKLNAADHERDDRFLGFKGYVSVCMYRKQEVVQMAAQEINRVIHRYGGDLYRMANAEESAALDNLIMDLKAEPYKIHIATIKAEEWFAEMEADQQAYKALVQEQVVQSNSSSHSVINARKPLVKACRSLLSMIELQQTASENPAISILIDQLNNHISKSVANARLSHSLTGNETEAEKEKLVE